jgi:AcrR family transcriptional regulator
MSRTPDPARPPRRVRSDGLRTREAILDAARQLFVERGFQATTVRAIAERAGVNPSLVVRYFNGKEALFLRIARDEALQNHSLTTTVTHIPLNRRGKALVERQLHMGSRATSQRLSEQIQLLLRSVDHQDGTQALSDLLTREYFETLYHDMTGPDRDLRIALAGIQLLGLTLGRDILGMRALTDASWGKIARYLGASIQYLLTPPNSPRL